MPSNAMIISVYANEKSHVARQTDEQTEDEKNEILHQCLWLGGGGVGWGCL